jgi:FkbM family methyltransferase
MPRQINTLIAAPWGPMIVSRMDRVEGPEGGYGVGYDLLEHGDYDPQLRNMVISMLLDRRTVAGPGLVVFDVGANIGAFSIPWALALGGTAQIYAYEPQKHVYHLLCANVALNNLFPVVYPVSAAVGAAHGEMAIPWLNPNEQASFGSLSLRRHMPQDTGQTVDYETRLVTCDVTTVDEQAMGRGRLDLLKIDVEGMEPEVLAGAAETLRTHHPIVIAEVTKCGTEAVTAPLREAGYTNIRQLDRLNIVAEWK